MANRVKINSSSDSEGKTIINAGDTIQVHQKIKEGDKERIQVFEGIVIAIKGTGTGKSFTVRRIASGAIGVERIWPVICPSIAKVVVKKKGNVRRAKLYYLRKRIGKQAIRVKSVKTKKDVENEKKKPRKPGRKPSPKTSKK